MIERKRYIVYPYGAHSWEEIAETVELLKYEGANPKIVKHNGFWNVEAESKVVKPTFGLQRPPNDLKKQERGGRPDE